jgi:hypothetical protein
MKYIAAIAAASLVGACSTPQPVAVSVAPIANSQRVACPQASAAQRRVLTARVSAPPKGTDVTLGALQERIDALNADADRKARTGMQIARELDKCAGR